MRISSKDGLRGEKDGILLGSHIDSTLPAPGAAELVFISIMRGM